MAEFQEVMNHWRRMCKAQDDGSNRDVCATCPLKPGCSAIYEDDDMDYVHVEQVVMKWAAEHPEPIYPTWEEYLISKGLLMPYWNEQGTAPYDMYIYAERALANPIPADIAQKLGVEPKEG